VEVKGVHDFEHAFAAIKRDGSGALLISGDPLFVSNRK
jgi:hypothetical protein